MLTDPMTIPPAAGLGARALELTMPEDRIWGSWHLYGISPDNYVSVVSALLPQMVKEFSTLALVDGFFFIRYADDQGHHVRVRFRFCGPGSEASDHVDRRISCMGTPYGLTVVKRQFEPEVSRYGGLDYLPLSLDFFCLSSLTAMNWLKLHADEPRSKQLSALMGLLVRQAVALARGVDELTLLLDYFAGWRAVMEAPTQHGNRTFESQPKLLTSLMRANIEAALSPEPLPKALIEGGRALSSATLGLPPKARRDILVSQMHMTANRLGLRNTEESYVTQILRRAFYCLLCEDPNDARNLNDGLACQQTAASLDVLASELMREP